MKCVKCTPRRKLRNRNRLCPGNINWLFRSWAKWFRVWDQNHGAKQFLSTVYLLASTILCSKFTKYVVLLFCESRVKRTSASLAATLESRRSPWRRLAGRGRGQQTRQSNDSVSALCLEVVLFIITREGGNHSVVLQWHSLTVTPQPMNTKSEQEKKAQTNGTP
jgi:hypothetical protein